VVDWGTVPDWFGGIGTTGAFVATLYIIGNERRKAARAQAEHVIIWEEGGRDISGFSSDGEVYWHDQGPYTVHLTNTSRQSIFRPSVLITEIPLSKYAGPSVDSDEVLANMIRDIPGPPSDRWAMFRNESGSHVRQLLPEQHVSVTAELRLPRSMNKVKVQFRDAAGALWTADPTSGIINRDRRGSTTPFLPMRRRRRSLRALLSKKRR